MQSIIKGSSNKKDEETQDLQSMKGLPANGQADNPDDNGAQAIKYHPGGGADLFRDTDTSKVEEGNAADIAQQGYSNKWQIANLTEGIYSIFQYLPWATAETAPRYEVHGHQDDGEYDEPKETC